MSPLPVKRHQPRVQPTAIQDPSISTALLSKFNKFVGQLTNFPAVYVDTETNEQSQVLMRFDSNFESGLVTDRVEHINDVLSTGNLHKVLVVSPFEFDLYMRADIANIK